MLGPFALIVTVAAVEPEGKMRDTPLDEPCEVEMIMIVLIGLFETLVGTSTVAVAGVDDDVLAPEEAMKLL